jgi:hypothetical protein
MRTVDPREAAAAARVPDDNRQARLNVWMDAVVARAAALMPTSWDRRLGGTDIFLTDNLNTVAWGRPPAVRAAIPDHHRRPAAAGI